MIARYSAVTLQDREVELLVPPTPPTWSNFKTHSGGGGEISTAARGPFPTPRDPTGESELESPRKDPRGGSGPGPCLGLQGVAIPS